MRYSCDIQAGRNHRVVAARYLMVLLLVGALMVPTTSNTGVTPQPEVATSVPDSAPEADKPHLLAASYYSLQGNLLATLTLNNKSPKPLEVKPTLFNLFGDRFDVPAVTVDATSFRVVNLNEWAALAGATFREGSLQLFYKGHDLLLGAQIKLIDTATSQIFDEQLVEPAVKFASQRLEGVWWLPSPHCQLSLVLSNTTDSPLSLFIAVDGTAPIHQAPITLVLQPHETRVDDVMDLTGHSGGVLLETGGISIEHSGPKGALLARGMIQEASVGYSSAIQFADPMKAKSSKLHGAGLRLGKVGDEQLIPVIVARNVGNTGTVLTGRIPYTKTDGGGAEVSIGEVTLRSGEARALKLNSVIERLRRDDIASAGLEVEYDSEPGSVIVSALSRSKSGNHVFHVPMSDIAALPSSTGGYPWSIEVDSATVVYLKNVTDTQQKYSLQLDIEDPSHTPAGGFYGNGIKTIEPGQTIALDIRELRDKQVPDTKGRRISLDATRGQVYWSMKGSEKVGIIGRAEQVDIFRGLSSSYACLNCCGDSFNGGWCLPGSVDGLPGDTTQFTAWEQYGNCYGYVYDPWQVSALSWSSTNTAVATVNSSGFATAQNPGSTTIKAHWRYEIWRADSFGNCSFFLRDFFGEAFCNVLYPVVFTEVRWGGQSFPFDLFGNATVNLSGGACAGEQFSILVKFNLRDSRRCCWDDRTWARVSSNNKFEWLGHDVFDLGMSGEMDVFLRRRADQGGTDNKVLINIFGERQNGLGYNGSASVRLNCQ